MIIYPNVFFVYFFQGISGLQNCVQLEKLYLYDNQICEIKNLELQVNLEVLWLNNNHISHIQVRTITYKSMSIVYLLPWFTTA